MEPQIGITKANLEASAHALGPILADEIVLYMKTRRAHWNVIGRDFYPKHTFFEMQYNELDEILDSVAERIRSLGHFAPDTLKSVLELTHLTEAPGGGTDGLELTKELLNDHESLVIVIRELIKVSDEQYHDIGTNDFLTNLLRAHEKMAWMLRSNLQ